MNGGQLRSFLSCNRFFYDLLKDPNVTTLTQVADRLCLPCSTLRNALLKFKLPCRLKLLRSVISSIPEEDLGAPPPVYVTYHKYVREGRMFDDQSLELFFPLADYHFDYKFLLLERFPSMTRERLNVISSEWFSHVPYNTNWADDYFTDDDTRNFRSEMIRRFEALPECIRVLSNDELFDANSDLSLTFLHGVVAFPINGVSSPHLHGQFLLGLRREGTGYLAIDASRAANRLGTDKWTSLLDWFRHNHPLYEDFTPITRTNFDVRLGTAGQTAEVVAAQLPSAPHILTNEKNQVLIRMKGPDGTESERRYVSLETALTLSFPVLFPFGCPILPGATLRKKARFLLASHPFYRCGRLQCHLGLFLYHIIQDSAIRFAQSQLSLQPTVIPTGASRDIPPDLFFNDPSAPAYWSRRQAEVRAMCREFGDPDLMLTLTFVNKWEEVTVTEQSLRQVFNFPLDSRFCPLETLMIWKSRFYDAKGANFEELMQALGFGPVKHFVWRMEFQVRGAPHVHALIWLQNRLPLSHLEHIMFATKPSSQESPKLFELVTGPMVHSCSLQRCKRGDPNARCRYGFPKAPCRDIHVSEDGVLALPRGSDDALIVDYSPSLLLKWGGHAHIHILRTEEHPECSPNAIYYIVKYNFKNEPSLRVEAGSEDNLSTLLHSRVISSEEAISRIFSFHYFGADTTCDFLSLQPPERRVAAFVHGEQVQLPDVEKYFLRPASLDRLPILAFFSLYEVTALPQTNRDLLAHPDETLIHQYGNIYRNHSARPPGSLSTQTWEDENLPELAFPSSARMFLSETLPNARALKCTLRATPKIVLTDKLTFATDINVISYIWLLLNGSWRSDTEIAAGCDSWVAALAYHGLSSPMIAELYQAHVNMLDYMLQSCRYSPMEVAVTLSRLESDLRPVLITRRNNATPAQSRDINMILSLLDQQQMVQCSVVPDLEPADMSTARTYINCAFTDDEIQEANRRLQTIQTQLNCDQRTVFNHVSQTLDLGSLLTVFVSGKAGTGKSFLIDALTALLTSRNLSYITCASTGIAASLIRGRTVHSAFGIFTNPHGETISSLTISRPAGHAISLCQVIIIDEITMISRSVLNCLDTALRKLAAQSLSPHYDAPFGGKHILLFGDLAQVPAVVSASDDFQESAEQFFASLPFSSFQRFSLNQLMRQNPGEHELLALLEDVRSLPSRLSPQSLEILRSRFRPGLLEDVVQHIDEFVGGDSPTGMVVTFTNAHAERYNELILASRISVSHAEPITFRALFFVSSSPSFRVPDNPSLDEVRLMQQSLCQPQLASESEIRIFLGAFRRRAFNSIVPFNLVLCPGARVMLLQNIDVANGLINGARGVVVSILTDKSAIEVLFDCQGADATPILITRRRSVEYPLSSGKHIFMFQFPLKLCWAVTAHKSQGQSLSRVAIDISEPAFAHGSLYVAISRVHSLDGLLLFGQESFPENGPLYHVNQFIQVEDQAPDLNDL